MLKVSGETNKQTVKQQYLVMSYIDNFNNGKMKTHCYFYTVMTTRKIIIIEGA